MHLVFDFPRGWQIGLPLVLAALVASAWWGRRRGQGWGRLGLLGLLRGLALLLLVFLVARPVWVAKDTAESGRRPVVLLVDRSESMSLEEAGGSRYRQALDFSRDKLLPALKAAGLPVQAVLFAEDAVPARGDDLAATKAEGKRTNLGGAIVRSFANAGEPPLAVVALTDGAVNESADNNHALTFLAESGVPFIGIGFGNDAGVQTLSLRNVEASPVVPPKTAFSLSAQLESVNTSQLPEFELWLFRDNQMVQKKTIKSGQGSRLWLENFLVTEEKEGAHHYEVRLQPPAVPGLKCVNDLAGTSVRISNEKELRVLYIQGALTWDYKFVVAALRDDPAMKLTGLTRTSKQSIFRQNVESSGELINGFPTTLEEMSPFRVIVLSNLKPADLTTEQQEMLGRFVGELGGGLLMIGGSATFDSSWQGSRLEQLLPVVFSSHVGVKGLDRPFHLQLTEEALQHSVFQISEGTPVRDAWSRLPAFTQYGVVDAAKPGAQVWARHQSDEGPNGRRILMASQRFGAGLSAVICIQNFWRWRLAKDAEPLQFDRFWRQLFRYLSEIGRQDVSIHFPDQEIHPRMEVQVVLEKQPSPAETNSVSQRFLARVESPEKKLIAEQAFELEPRRPRDFKFPAERAGVYSITVQNDQKVTVATRALEVRDINVEFQNTGRNLEILGQWAAISDGLALKAEDCRDGAELVQRIRTRAEQARHARSMRQPAGMNGWTLAVLLGCLGGEWVLRKRWGLA